MGRVTGATTPFDPAEALGRDDGFRCHRIGFEVSFGEGGMMTTRRDFLAASGTLAATAIVASSALGALPAGLFRPGRGRSSWALGATGEDPYFPPVKIADSTYSLSGEGGNSLAFVAGGGTLLIDTKNAGFGSQLRRDVESLGAPLKMVINTHHHYDHTGGNAAFTKDATVLAHESAKQRIGDQVQLYARNLPQTLRNLKDVDTPTAKRIMAEAEALGKEAATPAAYQPTKTTRGNETLNFGGESIELVHVGPGHTDNDLIVFFPKQNVIHTGDLVFNKVHPYFDPAGGATVQGWIKSLEKIITLCNDKTVLVPGHGDVGDVNAAKAQIAYHRRVHEEAKKAVNAKKTREEFQKSDIDEYKSYGGAWIKPIAFGAIFDEVVSGK